MKRVPLWLKVGFSLWVAVWAWVYQAHYGAQNFLWFCDVANFVIAAALWAESPLLLSAQAASVLLPQLVWTLDVGTRLVFGVHPVGGTEYMFNPAIPVVVRLFSLFHVATPALLLWAIGRMGYDRRGWVLQTLATLALLPVSYLFGPEKNINWTWGPFGEPQRRLAPGVYLALCVAAYPLLLYLPTHLVLRRLYRHETSLSHSVTRHGM